MEQIINFYSQALTDRGHKRQVTDLKIKCGGYSLAIALSDLYDKITDMPLPTVDCTCLWASAMFNQCLYGPHKCRCEYYKEDDLEDGLDEE